MTKKFGTFAGVFTPTILTIIGVIMYLRLGWVVGSVGLTGALIIIGLAHVATITTALSLSSMATNAKVGAGGFYALVSRSLGPEIGGAIGIPLYVSQTLGTALYIIGFSEVWLSLFPSHDGSIVSAVVLLILLLVSYFGADLAMKFQFAIMTIIALSLFSFFASEFGLSVPFNFGLDMHGVSTWSQAMGSSSFWHVFAVFFPAVTGIGAGAAMSGDLKDPSKSLPIGILSATFVGLVIYIGVTFWYAGLATKVELINNYLIIVQKSAWSWLVIAGIMGATLSSALGSLVAAPRILYATALDKVIPFSKTLSARSKKGDPRNSILLTGVLVWSSLQIGNLNMVASLLTMFFLISYAMINISLFLELILKIPSFRPKFRIPAFIPFIGAVWCITIMFLINPLSAIGSLVFIATMYIINVRRNIEVSFSDIRSGIFNAIAEWAVKKSFKTPENKKSWKPNMLLPIENPKEFNQMLPLVDAMVMPSGTVRVVSVVIKSKIKASKLTSFIRQKLKLKPGKSSMNRTNLEGQLNKLAEHFKNKKLLVTTTVAEASALLEGMQIIIQTIKGLYLPPNIICLKVNHKSKNLQKIEQITSIAEKEKLGIILATFPGDKKTWLTSDKNDISHRRFINVWLRSESPNINLAILLAIQLQKNWNCFIRLISTTESTRPEEKIKAFHNHIIETSRLHKTESVIINTNFNVALEQTPNGDLSIFGMAGNDYAALRSIADKIDRPCLFVKDSGQESAFV